MPLSEEEQRILQEMEQKLREHDRDFLDRVSHRSRRLESSRGTRWAIVGFLAGTVLLLSTFRSSLGLGICGILVMVVSALAFAQHLGGADTVDPRSPESRRRALDPPRAAGGGEAKALRPTRNPGIAEEWSEMRRRMRSRFGHRG
ncbi:MAG: DUF3040 domain-containing protein [Acidimicrobiales bacterium]